jgi:hypothetical protein
MQQSQQQCMLMRHSKSLPQMAQIPRCQLAYCMLMMSGGMSRRVQHPNRVQMTLQLQCSQALMLLLLLLWHLLWRSTPTTLTTC